MREKVYKIAGVLSIIFVFDGLFMAWAMAAGGYAGLTYVNLSFFPLFVPAVLVGLVITAIYANGVARRSWTLRKSEVAFFLVLFLAVVYKVTPRWWDEAEYGQCGAAHCDSSPVEPGETATQRALQLTRLVEARCARIV